MPDIQIDYARVEAVVNQLNTLGPEIQAQLNSLQTKVATLLSPTGGLWMTMSSPALSTSYENFNLSLNKMIASIGDFATNFQSIASNLKEMDRSIAAPSAAQG